MSVPRADRDPHAGSPRGVVDAPGSMLNVEWSIHFATSRGTDTGRPLQRSHRRQRKNGKSPAFQSRAPVRKRDGPKAIIHSVLYCFSKDCQDHPKKPTSVLTLLSIPWTKP